MAEAGRIRVGIGGWTFPPWRGVFYPAGLPHARELEHAAGRLTAIEINATFHGSQKPESFRKWAAAVPDGFVFALKGSRYVTNRRVLAEAAPSLERFVGQGIAELGDRLGPILWQMAATKRFDPDDITRFLDLLPREAGGLPLRHAVEALHESFDDDAWRRLAAERNVAVAHVEAAGGGAAGSPAAGFAYARFKESREDEADGYPARELDRIARLAEDWRGGGRRVFAFFIAGDKVRAPAAAEALIGRVGGR